MKSKEQKLLELLQPKDYVSKIKLYCYDCEVIIKKYSEINVVKFAQLENK